MSYTIRLSIPVPSQNTASILARVLLAIHEVGVKHFQGDMHVGPVHERRLQRQGGRTVPCVLVTLWLDDDVDRVHVDQALNVISAYADAAALPSIPSE